MSLNAPGLDFDTALIERRLDQHTRTLERDPHVALLGVDNLATRRLLSEVNWAVAIDVGFGAGPDDFNALLLHRFPATRKSHEISSWSGTPRVRIPLPNTPALDDLRGRDPCGVVELAGTAVSASFVGVTAACLAVTERHPRCARSSRL